MYVTKGAGRKKETQRYYTEDRQTHAHCGSAVQWQAWGRFGGMKEKVALQVERTGGQSRCKGPDNGNNIQRFKRVVVDE